VSEAPSVTFRVGFVRVSPVSPVSYPNFDFRAVPPERLDCPVRKGLLGFSVSPDVAVAAGASTPASVAFLTSAGTVEAAASGL